MTSHTGGPPDPAWQRPTTPEPGQVSGVPESPPPAGAPAMPPVSVPPAYSGPPPTQPPPTGWRPPVYVEAPPPRTLAPQDNDAIDAREKDARTVTYGIGLVAAAILVVIGCLLCSRALF